MVRFYLSCLFIFFLNIGFGQFDLQDTLRGSLTDERVWWDVDYYHLELDVNHKDKTISGQNTIHFHVTSESKADLQIDLQPPMEIVRVLHGKKELKFESNGNAHFIKFPGKRQIGQSYAVTVEYQGKPKKSRRPPWEGGFTWTKDKEGHPFIATTCQGDGASLWWPCKDHPSDEADSVLLSITVEKPLVNVSNGRLVKVDDLGDRQTWHWFVRNPINNYGVNLNIGHYTHFSEVYPGLKGDLTCDYYVLPYNLEKAKTQFLQVPLMLDAFEYWFGPYPFYEDGYKLVEVPYLGMEHQSSVTYGNRYGNGYYGRDLSQSGMGLLFDFIIIHESGHEWFANNITAADNADMWIHESFTAYSENLYLDYHYGHDTCAQYVIGTRSNIKNDRPIQGTYGVNKSGSGDMYYKGANMLHTLRHVIANDSIWRSILQGLNSTFYHQTILYDDLVGYINDHTSFDVKPIFDQYIKDIRIPILEYRLYPGGVEYRWSNCIEGFEMPVDIFIDQEKVRVEPTTNWQRLNASQPEKLEVDSNYYIAQLKIQ